MTITAEIQSAVTSPGEGVLARQLLSTGYRQPIQSATVPPLDIDITDLYLADMSGYEVLRSLRASKVKTPILIVTGRSGIGDPRTIPDIIVATSGSLRFYGAAHR